MAPDSTNNYHQSRSSSSKRVKHESSTTTTTTTTTTSDDLFSSNFPTERHSIRFHERFETRPVDCGRTFDLDLVKSITNPFSDSMKENGVWKMLELPDSTYPNLVRIFYSNLTAGNVYTDLWKPESPENLLTSFVDSKPVVICPDSISRLLGIAPGGAVMPNKQNFDGSEACRVIFNDPSITSRTWRNAIDKFKTKALSVEHRILHFVVTFVYNPRLGNHAGITNEDLWLMGNIVSGKKIDFGQWVINNIRKALNKESQRLPYGRLISYLLKFEDVRMENDRPVKSHFNKFNTTTLTRSGFVCCGNRWSRDAPAVDDSNDEENEVDGADETAEEDTDGADHGSIALLKRQCLELNTNVNEAREEIQRMHTRLDAQNLVINNILEQFRLQTKYFRGLYTAHGLQFPPPSSPEQ